MPGGSPAKSFRQPADCTDTNWRSWGKLSSQLSVSRTLPAAHGLSESHGEMKARISRHVPGVIGHVGTVLAKNRFKIASFSLGRREGPSAAHRRKAPSETARILPVGRDSHPYRSTITGATNARLAVRPHELVRTLARVFRLGRQIHHEETGRSRGCALQTFGQIAGFRFDYHLLRARGAATRPVYRPWTSEGLTRSSPMRARFLSLNRLPKIATQPRFYRDRYRRLTYSSRNPSAPHHHPPRVTIPF